MSIKDTITTEYQSIAYTFAKNMPLPVSGELYIA